MFTPEMMREAADLAARFKPDTPEYQRAMIYTGMFAFRALEILKSHVPGTVKQLSLATAHELHLCRLRNLLEPITPDDGPLPELPHVSDNLVLDLMCEWVLLIGALGMVVSAWDTVRPIGWVATNKAEPGIILSAVKNAKQLYANLVPNS